MSASDVPQQVASAVLIGVDLGPNLSVNRIACNDPLAVRAAARKSGSECLKFSETLFSGDASCSAARDCGSARHRLSTLLFLAPLVLDANDEIIEVATGELLIQKTDRRVTRFFRHQARQDVSKWV